MRLVTCLHDDIANNLDEDGQLRCAYDEVRAGRDAQALGLYPRALAHYQRALFYKEDLSAAHNAIGEVLLANNEAALACNAFTRAITYDASNYTAKRNLSQCYVNLGQLRQARAVLNACEGAWDLECYCSLGQDALGPFGPELPDGLRPSDLLATCPQMRTLAVDRCATLLQQGDCEAAAQACNQALAAWPQNRVARSSWRRAQACVIDGEEARMMAKRETQSRHGAELASVGSSTAPLPAAQE